MTVPVSLSSSFGVKNRPTAGLAPMIAGKVDEA